MGLLIKGMDMPKDYQQHNINLFNTADGFWADEYRFENNESKYKTRLLYSVAEIPTPHGRLIDADAHIQSLKENQCGERCRKYHDCVNCGIGMYIRIVENEPTIIEAED